MLLRNNQALKFFAIVLFSFELFAPAFLSSGQGDATTDSSTKITISTSHTNICAFLAIEEINEEEREGKDLLPIPSELSLFQQTSFLLGSIHQPALFSSNQNLFVTHPPLYRLNKTLLI